MAAGSQCRNEGQRVDCPSEAVMNWWTSRRGLDLRMSAVTVTGQDRDAIEVDELFPALSIPALSNALHSVRRNCDWGA